MPVTKDSDGRDGPFVDMSVLPDVVLDPSAIKVVPLIVDDNMKPLSLVVSTLDVEAELLDCVAEGELEVLGDSSV